MRRTVRYLVLFLTLCGLASWAPARAQFSFSGSSFDAVNEPDESDGENKESAGNRDLGTAAVALVEEVRGAPDAGVEMMDYVFPNQAIALGGGGVIILNHLDGCLVETITGGTVTVKRKGSVVANGRRDAKRTGRCRPEDGGRSLLSSNQGSDQSPTAGMMHEDGFGRRSKSLSVPRSLSPQSALAPEGR